MERTKYRLIIILGVLFALNVHADNRSEIYNSYINNQMPAWKVLIDQLSNNSETDDVQLHELLNYQYGYIAWCLGNNRKDEAAAYLKLAEKNLKLLELRKFNPSRVNGYKAAFYGFRIGLSMFSAPFLGPKSAACAKQSILLGPDDPFGYIQSGNVQMHTPALMGGSKTEALRLFLTAKILMEKNGEGNRGDWNYLSLLTSVAKAYDSTGDYPKAKLIYEEILRFEPGFKWVRDELYPQLLKKIMI
jgi:tetratricopeptide (TPR) repeat protein